ncbi:serine hydrolase [Tumidithrix helvetica PCC 7403]|uniref:serine hydrolase n=1 Tax=Tumidithrix helvetica TaxID=3457545 RepID=UPI003C974A38
MKLSRRLLALIGISCAVGISVLSAVSLSAGDRSMPLSSTFKKDPKKITKRTGLCRDEVLTCLSQVALRWTRSTQYVLVTEQQQPMLALSKIDDLAANNRKHITADAYALEVKHSEFLAQIATDSGLSPSAMITVCQLGGECRHLRGNQRLDNPASLIKVPIALLLLHKSDAENLSLNTKTLVSPDNFTEDKSDIGVGEELPLKTLLFEMITHSSNIATNQLIDYLGWDYMNRTLHDLGYQSTEVNFKVVGEETMPADPGNDSNRLTSDELTQIMLDTYSFKYASAHLLVEALRLQADLDLGFAALQNTPAEWLGEKTGQTSDVLGTTLAMRIADKIYIVTAIDDNTGGEEGLRDCIHRIANYISDRENF